MISVYPCCTMRDMRDNPESGQSLLVIVLLISVVFTLIATASYRLTTETQSTRLQEESIKTLAAADSGVERGIQYATDNAETTGAVTFSDLGMVLPGINPTASTLNITASTGPDFLSPLITKDDQFTFYLYKYPNGTTSLTQNVNVHFADSLCPNVNGPALEITLIYGASGTGIYRWLADPCNILGGSGELPVTSGTYVFSPTTLRYRVTVPISTYASSQPKLLLVRTLGRATNIGFTIASGQLYAQGQNIRSEAVSTNGVTKIVTLFKSYPQIPADFFVTRF